MGQLGDISPEATVAIGIIVGLISTAVQSLGLTLQRQSHLREDEKIAPETRKPPYKRPRWQAGMGMFLVSNLVGSTIQITTLPLPVLSTLQASGLVFNTAFATLLLKEPFTWYSVIGTILTCAGAALIAIYGAVAEPAHNLQQLLDLLKDPPFIIWMAATLLVVVITIVLSHFIKMYSSYKHMSRHIQKTERPLSRSSSRLDKPGELRGRRFSFTAQLPRPMQIRLSRLKLLRGLCYALVSGILSAHSLLVAKSAVELIVRSLFDHDNQFNQFQSWLILVALLFFSLSQLYYLHLGLRLCSTSVLYPFVFCTYNIVAILDGLIYFRQGSRLTALHAGLVAVGTVILLSGILALSWRLDSTSPTEAAPQVVAAQTPLVPGMGMVSSSDDLERLPLLQSFSKSNTEPFPTLYDRKSTLTRPARRTTLTRTSISPGGAAARDIWAELDDEESSYDYLASLPRASSPLLDYKPNLNVTKKRRRASLPSDHELGSTTSLAERRRRTLNEYRQDRAQEATAMIQSASPEQMKGEDLMSKSTLSVNSMASAASGTSALSPVSSHRKRSRERKFTVRFEEENLRKTSPKRSRWDEGSKNTSDKDKDEDKNKPKTKKGKERSASINSNSGVDSDNTTSKTTAGKQDPG